MSCSSGYDCLKEGGLILDDFLPLGNRVKNGDSYLLDKHLAPVFTVVLLKVQFFSCALLGAQLPAFSEPGLWKSVLWFHFPF